MAEIDWSLWTTKKLVTTAYSLTHKIHAEEEVLRLDRQLQKTNSSFRVASTPGLGKAIHERAERIEDLRKQRDMITKEILRRAGE